MPTKSFQAPPPIPVRELPQPELTEDEADALYETTKEKPTPYLSSKGMRFVRESEHGVLNGETKYLLLRRVIDLHTAEIWGDFLRPLKYRNAGKAKRPCLKDSLGGTLDFGWFRDRNYGPRLFAGSIKHPDVYNGILKFIVLIMEDQVERHLPLYWKEQLKRARVNRARLIGSEYRDPRLPFRMFHDPILSSLVVNKDTTCRSHTDSNNKNGLSCMTVFGDFHGGELVFPRLRLAFDVRPGDVLIADTNREQHGNDPNMAGERISVIAYLKQLPQRRPEPRAEKPTKSRLN
jgi:hypothetical protein